MVRKCTTGKVYFESVLNEGGSSEVQGGGEEAVAGGENGFLNK